MSIQPLDLAEPFFSVRFVEGEGKLELTGSAVVLNLSEAPIRVRDQTLGELQSAIMVNTSIHDIVRAVVVERLDAHPRSGTFPKSPGQMAVCI